MRPPAFALLAALALLPLAGAQLLAPAALDCVPACNVRVSGGLGPALQPHVAIDPLDPQHLVAVAEDGSLGSLAACGQRNAWVGVYESTDGGRTWAAQRLPGHPAEALPGLHSVYACAVDPTVAIDIEDRVLVAALGLAPPAEGLPAGAGAGILAAESLDGGATWLASHALAPAGDGGLAGTAEPWITLDTSVNVGYVAWAADLAGTPAALTARTHNGLAWTPPNPTSGPLGFPPIPGPCHIEAGTSPHPFIGPGSIVNLGYYSPCDQHIRVGHSLDYGLTWEGIVRVAKPVPLPMDAAPVPAPLTPLSAVDNTVGPFQSFIYVLWHDQRTGSPDIVASVSRDLGHVYDAPVRVTDDPAGPAAQFLPAVAVGPDGVAHAAWYDQRVAPASGLVDVFYARSVDGGRTWSPNLRVTSASFDPARSLDHAGEATLGGHLGIAAGPGGTAHVLWTDTRDGRPDVYAARVV